MRSTAIFAAISAALSLISPVAAALDLNSQDNVVLYWGGGNNEDLTTVCSQTTADVIVIGFVTEFAQRVGEYPTTNFANSCWGTVFQYPNGTDSGLLDTCLTIEAGIPVCQATYGKKILLSLGGGGSDSQTVPSQEVAEYNADFLWGAFGPANGDGPSAWVEAGAPRPFKTAVVDGFDFDIENGGGEYLDAMVQRLRTYFTEGSYYISAAPQCAWTDANLNTAIQGSHFDWLFIQFYNTPQCSARLAYDELSTVGGDVNADVFWTYKTWHDNVAALATGAGTKLFLGLLAGPVAGNDYYLTPAEAQTVITYVADNYADTFAGVGLWDATAATANTVNGTDYTFKIKQELAVYAPVSSSASASASASVTATPTPTASASSSAVASSSPSASASASASAIASSSVAASSSAIASSSVAASSSANASATAVPTSSAAASSVASSDPTLSLVTPSASATLSTAVNTTSSVVSSAASSVVSSAASSFASSVVTLSSATPSAADPTNSTVLVIVSPSTVATSASVDPAVTVDPVVTAAASSLPASSAVTDPSFLVSVDPVVVTAVPSSNATVTSILVTPSASGNATLSVIVVADPTATTTVVDPASTVVVDPAVASSAVANATSVDPAVTLTTLSIPAASSSASAVVDPAVSAQASVSVDPATCTEVESSVVPYPVANATVSSLAVTAYPSASVVAVSPQASEVITTVVVTSYVDVCPTGLTTITGTLTVVSTVCPKCSAKPTPAVSETTITKVCHNCAATPVTVTVTKPVYTAVTSLVPEVAAVSASIGQAESRPAVIPGTTFSTAVATPATEVVVAAAAGSSSSSSSSSSETPAAPGVFVASSVETIAAPAATTSGVASSSASAAIAATAAPSLEQHAVSHLTSTTVHTVTVYAMNTAAGSASLSASTTEVTWVRVITMTVTPVPATDVAVATAADAAVGPSGWSILVSSANGTVPTAAATGVVRPSAAALEFTGTAAGGRITTAALFGAVLAAAMVVVAL